jgi:periplasmic copper chaperone A
MYATVESGRPGRRRRTGRLVAASLAGVAVSIATASAAQAHVTVQPSEVEGGGFSVVSFRVPNERDDAATTRLRVTLPEDQPMGSVRTTPVPGWKISTETRQLDEPIELFGEELDTVVSEITWKATDEGIQPGQYVDFDVSIGQLPESGELVFQAEQTYSSGEKVDWNEVAVGDAEPEHPAPVLSLTPPAADGTADPAAATATGADGAADAETDSTDEAAADTDSSNQALPLTLSGLALVLSMVAVGLAWSRRRA